MIKRTSFPKTYNMPKAPALPSKTITSIAEREITNGASIQDLLNGLPKNIHLDKVRIFEVLSSYGHSLNTEYSTYVRYDIEKPNENYEKELSIYNEKLKIFKEKEKLFKQMQDLEKQDDKLK